MPLYVNHDAINDVFEFVRVSNDIADRVRALEIITMDFERQFMHEQARLCYDMKIDGSSTGQIADELQISERAVKRAIGAYTASRGIHNPLMRRYASNVVDISSRVGKAP